jgi:hypothetical protein
MPSAPLLRNYLTIMAADYPSALPMNNDEEVI